MKYLEIKTEKENRINTLISTCEMFFAFSNEQFNENKTTLKEGDKYVSLGSGAFLPKSQLDKWKVGLVELTTWEKTTIKAAKQQTAQIVSELSNYECFYTGDITDSLPALSNYSREQVQRVFNENRKQYQQF